MRGQPLTVGSLFAGIGGFDLGFERAGYTVAWQVEQDVKAQSVLSQRFPEAALYDDVRTVGHANLQPVDVITGGFPCQDVSVAGKRAGLEGERTGLFWEVVRVARELSPKWMVLENVPGLLSSHGGRDFHAVLAALAECGFRREYRILDSRYFGVAQRRRRVFLVLRARRAGVSPVPVLFESESRRGDSSQGAEAGARLAATLRGRSHGAGVNMPGRGGEDDANLICGPLGGGNDGIGRRSEDDPNLVVGVHANQRGELRTSALAGSLNGSRSGKQFEGVMATLNSGGNTGGFRTEPGEHLVVGTLTPGAHPGGYNGQDAYTGHLLPTLQASMGHHGHSSPRGDGSDPLVCITETGKGWWREGEPAIRAHGGGSPQQVVGSQSAGVRRLTPLECERLQGFPDGWTCLCGNGHRGSQFCECADSPRYRQLGNAVTVTVAEWIAHRIKEADAA